MKRQYLTDYLYVHGKDEKLVQKAIPSISPEKKDVHRVMRKKISMQQLPRSRTGSPIKHPISNNKSHNSPKKPMTLHPPVKNNVDESVKELTYAMNLRAKEESEFLKLKNEYTKEIRMKRQMSAPELAARSYQPSYNLLLSPDRVYSLDTGRQIRPKQQHNYLKAMHVEAQHIVTPQPVMHMEVPEFLVDEDDDFSAIQNILSCYKRTLFSVADAIDNQKNNQKNNRKNSTNEKNIKKKKKREIEYDVPLDAMKDIEAIEDPLANQRKKIMSQIFKDMSFDEQQTFNGIQNLDHASKLIKKLGPKLRLHTCRSDTTQWHTLVNEAAPAYIVLDPPKSYSNNIINNNDNKKINNNDDELTPNTPLRLNKPITSRVYYNDRMVAKKKKTTPGKSTQFTLRSLYSPFHDNMILRSPAYVYNASMITDHDMRSPPPQKKSNFMKSGSGSIKRRILPRLRIATNFADEYDDILSTRRIKQESTPGKGRSFFGPSPMTGW